MKGIFKSLDHIINGGFKFVNEVFHYFQQFRIAAILYPLETVFQFVNFLPCK